MKKSLSLLLFIFFSINHVNAQQKNQVYFDGEFYIKLKEISNFSSSKTTSSVDVKNEIPFLSQYSKFNILNVRQPYYFSKNENLKKIFRVKISDEENSEKFMANIKAENNIEYIERVPLNKVIYTPNDPSISSLYHLNKIKAYEAWDISRGNAEITVAVVDDAVQTDHPDLAANCIAGWDVVDNDNDPRPPSTSYSHGTHVAGIAGAVTDNAVGVSSVGFNKVKIMPVRTSNYPGYITHGYEGIAWAGSHGAKLINMSWGGGAYSTTDQQVINDAYNNGAILVAAAGNSSTSTPMYPAAYDNVIAVVSTNETDNISYFSNYGTWVDLCAPGSNIYSTVPFNLYDTYSGTSMASPLAAGSMAFIWSNFPNLSQTELINLVKSSCDNINSINPSYTGLLGSGRINVYNALHCSDFSVNITPAESPIVICQGEGQLLTANFIADANYQWFNGSQPISENNGNTLTVSNTGSYKVVISKEMCINASNTVNVTVVPIELNISSNRTPATLCGDSLIFSAPDYPGLTYTWFKNNQIIAGQNNRNLTVSAVGTYKLKIEGSDCTPVFSNEIVVNGVEYSINKTGPIIFCEGLSDTLRVNEIPGAFYQWKRNGNYIGNSSSQLVVNQNGSYKIEVTTGGCGTKESVPVVVSVIPNNINISTAGSPIICGVGNYKELKAPVLTGVSYQWYFNNQIIEHATNSNYFASNAGSYKVSLSGGACSKFSNAIQIEAVLVSANINPSGSIVLCPGQKVVLRTDQIAGASYQWKENDNLIGSNADSIEIGASGYYYVEIRKSTCLISSGVKVVSVMPNFLNVSTSGSLLLCPNTGVNLSVEGFSNGFNFEWKKNGQSIGSNTNFYFASSAGSYTVRMFTDNCSVQSDSIRVNQILENLVINPVGNFNLCTGSTLAISSSTIQNATYKWFKNDVEIPNSNSNTFLASQMGTYHIKANVNNCNFISGFTTLNIFSEQLLQPTNPVNKTICTGDSLVIGNGLSVTNPNVNNNESGEFNYSGPQIGYDGGYKSGNDPTITSTLSGNITYMKVKIIWEKKDGYGYSSCGTPNPGGWPYNNETQFQLISPDGTTTTIVQGGLYGGDYGGVVTTYFADDGSTIVPGYSPTSGIFKPYQPLSNYYNKSSYGQWRLLPVDLAGGDPLCVSGFSIYFETGGGPQEITWWPSNTGNSGKLYTGNEFYPRKTEPGTYTYYAQVQSTSKCNSDRIPVTLTITPTKPAKPAITATINGVGKVSPITLCGGETLTLTGNQCSDGIIHWLTGETGQSINVSPTSKISYWATCEKEGFCQNISDQSDLFEVDILPNILNLTQNFEVGVNQNFWAQNLNASGKILGQSNIEYSAGNSVILTPGFSVSANQGNKFKVFVGPCKNQ
ncbi:MAG: S8 family serine peptidase [Bacteroidetes bacterium]|nr:S8 family serine peptidase [Bacteroidota bacterium]